MPCRSLLASVFLGASLFASENTLSRQSQKVNAPANSGGFSIPGQIVEVGKALTPHEYSLIQKAIRRELQTPEMRKQLEKMPDFGSLDLITGTRIDLGRLGSGAVIRFESSGACGVAGNCPIWVFSQQQGRYRRLIQGGGWGFAVLPTNGLVGRPVPDLVFYWHISAGEQKVTRFHYSKGRFVASRSQPTTCPSVSSPQENVNPVCKAMINQKSVISIPPAEYKVLRPHLRSDLEKMPARFSQLWFDDAHGVSFDIMYSLRAVVIGLGSCRREGNCRLSIYAHKLSFAGGEIRYAEEDYWPLLLDVSGFGLANVSGLTKSLHWETAFVIARRVSAHNVELTRYAVVGNGPNAEPQPRDHMSIEGCEMLRTSTDGKIIPRTAVSCTTRTSP